MRTKYVTSTQALVALVAASGGRVESRIRLQKQVFLLRWLNQLPELSGFRFSYHHFGPYSRALSDVLHDAVLGGLLHEAREDFDNGHTRYTYSITEAGRRAIPAAPTHDPLTPVIQSLGSEHWRTLELAATALFLEQHRRLDSAEALERALALKPQCLDHRDDAEAVIEKLRSLRSAA